MALEINFLNDPEPHSLGNNVYEFLDILREPTCIFLSGEDLCRTRAFVTLLHGNEPSGVKALFRWLKSGKRPAVNTICIIASVEAASQYPVFSHRFVEPMRDLNRCFSGPFDDQQGVLAKRIIEVLQQHQPESIIDMHNTSGSGPSFAVGTFYDQRHEVLTSLFTQRLIITQLKLGALMEIGESLCPTVTIECGGRLDDDADQIAWNGLNNYFTCRRVFAKKSVDWGLEILTNPVRLELKKECELCYSEGMLAGYNLTLPPTIEHFNFGVTRKNTSIGWVDNEAANDLSIIFSCRNSMGESVLDELVYVDGNRVLLRQDLKLFMITNNPSIAKTDCLLYAVKSDGNELVL
ncbi:MAG: hypothetical protein ACI89U_001016 [Gammaproteobacteria bacterium]|jgi:hypothetical protein